MAKRGRPKKQNVRREPNGRASRSSGADSENVEQIEVRMRRYGLCENDARDQKAETVHGRMYLKKKITIQQYDAGEVMFKLRSDYERAIKAPNALVSGSGSGGDVAVSDEYTERMRGFIRAYDRAAFAIRDGQAVHRMTNLAAALDYMLFRNEYHRHMEGDFSVALHVLAVHLGLTKNSKSDSMSDIPRSQRCA